MVLDNNVSQSSEEQSDYSSLNSSLDSEQQAS